MEIEVISGPYELAEGPFWDERDRSLYFVDILQSKIHKYVPATDEHTSARVGDKSVSFIIPIQNRVNEYVISYGGDLAQVKWDGHSKTVDDLKIIARVDSREGNRINDAKVSPDGVLFLGSMGYRSASGEQVKNNCSLYCYKNGTAVELLRDISISNGLAWTADGSKLYYIDTYAFDIKQYDYDISTDSVLKNERVVFHVKNNSYIGLDGMTIDTDGKLWVAVYGGHKVLRIDPDTGDTLQEIKLPSKNITSVIFGGTNLDELFVTSSNREISEVERNELKTSGCLFKITGLGVKGTKSEYFPCSKNIA